MAMSRPGEDGGGCESKSAAGADCCRPQLRSRVVSRLANS